MNNKSKAQQKGKQKRFIYIGGDINKPNLAKLGMTSQTAKRRESDTTNPFYYFTHSYPIFVTLRELQSAEKSLHSILKRKYGRIQHISSGKDSEWFNCTPEEAKVEADAYLNELEERKQRAGDSIWELKKVKRPSSKKPKPKAATEHKTPQVKPKPTPKLVHTTEERVIKDCVQRRNNKRVIAYNYADLYFRCPECHKVTKQESGSRNLCRSCSFEISKWLDVDGVQELYQKYITMDSMNSKQAALFDIHNAIYFENVRRTTKAVERNKQPFHEAQASNSSQSRPQARQQATERKTESSSSTFGWIIFLVLLASFGYGLSN